MNPIPQSPPAAETQAAPPVTPPAPRHTRLYRFLYAQWWLSFLLLGVSFVLFGLASLNLIGMFSANFDFFAHHGLDAARVGGLAQLFELVVSGYTAAAFYLLFKLCEKVLVDRLSAGKAEKNGP